MTWPFRFGVLSIFTFALLVAGCNSGRDEKEPPAPKGAATPASPGERLQNPATWRSDPTLASKLGDYAEIEGYELRLPKGFEKIGGKFLPNGVGKVALWGGVPRDDGTRCVIIMTVMTAPKDAPQYDVSEKVLATLTLQIPRFKTSIEMDDMQLDATEAGRVGNLYFVRKPYHGTLKNLDKVSGVFYAGIEGKTIVCLTIVDTEPHCVDSSNVATAAILTLRKRL